jgi:hypothetical protein
VAFGLLAPLSAQAGNHSGHGNGNDKPWICHPVEGHGEHGNGWNVINPDEHSSHINEKSGAGKHDRKDGRTDTYASGGGKDCEHGYPTPTHTKTHHPKPTCTTTTHHPKPTHTKPYPTTTTTVTESVTTPATVTSTTTATKTTTTTTTSSTPVTPATSPSNPPESPASNPPAVAPAPSPPAAAPVAEVPQAPAVAAPQQAAVVQNAVPQAATDGADLQPQAAGWAGLQPVLIGAGMLLLLAAGLLSGRRRSPTS